MFTYVLCDLTVVTLGSMSQCHGHCNASCHMSHTGHYTLHYNTASINHYTPGSDGSLPNNEPLSSGHLVTANLMSSGGGRQGEDYATGAAVTTRISAYHLRCE